MDCKTFLILENFCALSNLNPIICYPVKEGFVRAKVEINQLEAKLAKTEQRMSDMEKLV